LKNALLPVISVLSPVFVFIVTGTFVTELIFGIPGMSKYFDTSITNRDYPVITGTLVWYAIVLLVVDLVVDIVRAFLDPRLRRTSIL
jgi:ABC-type dipeptide/oligopeptide/nickel transport system permease component